MGERVMLVQPSAEYAPYHTKVISYQGRILLCYVTLCTYASDKVHCLLRKEIKSLSNGAHCVLWAVGVQCIVRFWNQLSQDN